MSDSCDNELHIAAAEGNLVKVQSLVYNDNNDDNDDDDFDIDALGTNEETALFKAAENGHADVVQFLLGFNPKVHIPNSDDNYPLFLAAHHGHAEVVKLLIKEPGYHIDDVHEGLIHSSFLGHIEVLEVLVQIPGIDINYADDKGNSSLYIASENRCKKAVKVLLQVPGININEVDEPSGNTSLHCLAPYTNDMLDEFVALINLGANITIKNKQDKTCFDLLHSSKMKLQIFSMLQLKFSLLEAHDYALWFHMVQVPVADSIEMDLFDKLLAMVEVLVTRHPILADAKDIDGRTAVDVASEAIKLVIQSVLLWHGRYRITELRPEHISSTCYVFKAVDEQTMDNETGQPLKVALKLMRLKDQFQREILTRNNDFNPHMVMNVLQQMKPTQTNKPSMQSDHRGVYSSLQAGRYSTVAHRCVDDSLHQIFYYLRSTDPTKLGIRYRCSKHEHDLFRVNYECRNYWKCMVCGGDYMHDRLRYSCVPCYLHICTPCFYKETDHQEIPAEGTTWLFLMKEDNDQPEIELARSEGPALQVSDAVFPNIKVVEGEDGTVIVDDIQTIPNAGQDDEPNEVMDVEVDASGQLTKTNAEKFYWLVMPLADRNLYVAFKQERWAGRNMEEVRHVFVQLVHCVEHMHEKGILHADLKPLNMVRTAGQWKLIDLDAACFIGKESVGHKSSSAYVPPEAIYIDEKMDTACVRSVVAVAKGEANYDLLMAHPSFDVWSLGCILYQMVNNDVKPLFQGGQDDNLVGVHKGMDNLFALAEWNSELKADKLVDIPDRLARNLLSQMLHKDPLQRPTLARVLAHSFLSGKKVARLVGEKPKYDVFLSYRVASDAHHVEKLYHLLTAQGFKVYWDKLCLLPGVDWEQGFCEGLVSSRAFVPLLSRDAINHPDKTWQNFSQLTTDSNCDNVFLEHRLAVELQGLGLIEKIFPIFIGNWDTITLEYSHYFGSGCHPKLPEVTVKSVEEKLRHHMESQALGTPLVPDRTVKSVVDAITACQGAFLVGPSDATFETAATSIVKMLTDVPVTSSPRGGTHVHQTLLHSTDHKSLVAEIGTLQGKVDHLEVENSVLKNELDMQKDENDRLKREMENLRTALTSANALLVRP